MIRDESDWYSFSTPYEAPLFAGLGSIHWRFKCLARCKKCGREVGQTWACPRARWGKREDRPILTRKPNDEQTMTTIALLVHNNHVGNPASHERGCPVGAMPRAKHLLSGVTTQRGRA